MKYIWHAIEQDDSTLHACYQIINDYTDSIENRKTCFVNKVSEMLLSEEKPINIYIHQSGAWSS